MMWLMFFALTLPDQIKLEAEVPAATAHFEDLNADGAVDFWLRSDDDRLWILDGSAANGQLAELVYEPVAGIDPEPRMIDGKWQASFEDGDHLVVFREQQWQTQRQWQTASAMRDAAFMRQTPQGTLVPTHNGYELYANGCLVRSMTIRPSVQLSRARLHVVYPVIEPLDLDGDGKLDWVGTPIALSNQGKLGIWRALGDDEGDWAMLEFPPDRAVSLYAMGDVDGDGWVDLAVMTRPARGFSLFEEMGILFYRGTGPGEWSSLASQEIKSKQNLWQTGPLVLDSGGLYCYYYKGLFRSKFRIDRYAWDSDGFLDPKPVNEDWRMDGGDRLTMMCDRDLVGDQQKDLILADNTGVYVYEARAGKKLPFDEDRRSKLFNWPFSIDFDMDVAANDTGLWFPESDQLTDGWLRYRRQLAMVDETPQHLSFWFVVREPETGHLVFKRHHSVKREP